MKARQLKSPASFLISLALYLVVSGFSNHDVVVIDPPRLDVTCPDPAERAVLIESSTYRDLARSRAEAIHGWQTCSDALSIALK